MLLLDLLLPDFSCLFFLPGRPTYPFDCLVWFWFIYLFIFLFSSLLDQSGRQSNTASQTQHIFVSLTKYSTAWMWHTFSYYPTTVCVQACIPDHKWRCCTTISLDLEMFHSAEKLFKTGSKQLKRAPGSPWSWRDLLGSSLPKNKQWRLPDCWELLSDKPSYKKHSMTILAYRKKQILTKQPWSNRHQLNCLRETKTTQWTACRRLSPTETARKDTSTCWAVVQLAPGFWLLYTVTHAGVDFGDICTLVCHRLHFWGE